MPTPFDPSELLSLPLMANVATVTQDGAPRNAPMWYLWEDDALWLLGDRHSSTVQRLWSDARCAVEITNFDNEGGVLLHLGLRGEASIERMQPTLFRRLLTKYLGEKETWNAWFIDNIARIDDEDGRLIKLVPESVFCNNVSYFRTGPDLAWPKE